MSGIFKPLPGAQLNLDHPLARGLCGLWLMNENSGNLVHDYSGQNNTGTCIGMNDPPIATSGWNAGPHGGALAFDGGNDYVDCGQRYTLRKPFTIIASILPKNISVYPAIFSCGAGGTNPDGGIEFRIAADGRLNLMKGGIVLVGESTVNGAISNGIFYHVVVTDTIDGAWTFYIEGKNAGGGQSVHSFTDYAVMQIGWFRTIEILSGFISSVSIYNRALSAEEVAYLYAFPYCMFDDAGWEAWMASNNIPKFMNYYRQMRAA